jgi:tetratricopeptide (TPR) repeat protein
MSNEPKTATRGEIDGRAIAELSSRHQSRTLEPSPEGALVQSVGLQLRGQLPEAIKEYETAIRGAAVLRTHGLPGLNPDLLAMTFANLGVSYARMGDEVKAQENVRNASDTDADVIRRMASGLAQYLQRNPAAPGYLRLGLLLQKFGDAPEAQQAFARARQLDPVIALPAIANKVQP